MTKYNVALFDMDGVLFDSMPGHVIAYREVFSRHGVQMPDDTVYMCEGMKGSETFRQVATRCLGREVSVEEAEAMYQEKCEIYRQLPQPGKIPGVEHLMRRMKDDGWTVCVVTGSAQMSLIDKLCAEFPGIIEPHLIVCARDYAKGKPAPDPYLEGLRRTKGNPECTIVVENAPLGVRAGRAAGLTTLAVNTGPLDREIFVEAGATEVFDTMAQAEQWLFGTEYSANN